MGICKAVLGFVEIPAQRLIEALLFKDTLLGRLSDAGNLD
jgi:hypothetical protein